ncbi:MAG: hypothetical protein ABFC77_11160 [Thermoguttaceae bacterium]
MAKFTPDELRRAIEALAIIEQDGDPDEWAAILRQAQDSAPASDPWDNVAIGVRPAAEGLTRRLTRLIDAAPDDCMDAALRVYARDRGCAVYDAMLAYAAELSGDTPHPVAVPTTPVPRPAVRIVSDREGAA